MWEFMKRSLSFGIGAAMLTADRLRQFVDEAVERGEMTSEEAKKFVDDVTKRADEERKNMQSWIREQVLKTTREVGIVESSRVDALERRIDALERRLGAVTEPIGGPGISDIIDEENV